MPNQRLTQTQRQELKLSPQQIQLMKLLQLPLIELEQRIKEEIEANPALEDVHEDDYDDNEPNVDEPTADDTDNGENDDYNDDEINFSKDDEFDINDYLPEEDRDDYSYKLQSNNFSSDDDLYEAPIVNEETFQDYLNQQLAYHDLTEKQLEIGEYIIGNLDDNGYLNRPIPNITDDLLFKFSFLYMLRGVLILIFIASKGFLLFLRDNSLFNTSSLVRTSSSALSYFIIRVRNSFTWSFCLRRFSRSIKVTSSQSSFLL